VKSSKRLHVGLRPHRWPRCGRLLSPSPRLVLSSFARRARRAALRRARSDSPSSSTFDATGGRAVKGVRLVGCLPVSASPRRSSRSSVARRAFIPAPTSTCVHRARLLKHYARRANSAQPHHAREGAWSRGIIVRTFPVTRLPVAFAGSRWMLPVDSDGAAIAPSFPGQLDPNNYMPVGCTATARALDRASLISSRACP